MNCFVVLCIFLLVTEVVLPLQVIMERASVVEYNSEYVVWGKACITRFGRKSPYYFNLEGKIKYEWNNNVTLNFIFYEYLHNEYRRTFVEMHVKLCDAINADPYIGKMLAKSGVICPLPRGEYHFMNMTIDAVGFRNVWPFRKGKVMTELMVTGNTKRIGIIEIYVSFIQKKGN